MSQAARQHHSSASPFEASIGFSRAVRQGRRILVSGTAPIGDDGNCVAGDAEAQATRCFQIIQQAIESLGGSLKDVVRTRSYLVNTGDWQAVGRAHGAFFRDVRPASTMVVVAGLLDEAWRVEIEAEAEIQ